MTVMHYFPLTNVRRIHESILLIKEEMGEEGENFLAAEWPLMNIEGVIA